jgi:hypothetical protein
MARGRSCFMGQMSLPTYYKIDICNSLLMVGNDPNKPHRTFIIRFYKCLSDAGTRSNISFAKTKIPRSPLQTWVLSELRDFSSSAKH